MFDTHSFLMEKKDNPFVTDEFYLNEKLVNTLQLVTGTIGLLSQGGKAVARGCSIPPLGPSCMKTNMLEEGWHLGATSVYQLIMILSTLRGILPLEEHKLIVSV